MNVGNVIYHYELATARAQTIVNALIRVGYLSKQRWFVTELEFHPQTEVRIHIEEVSCGEVTAETISRVPSHLWERRATDEEDLQPIMEWAELMRKEQLDRQSERERADQAKYAAQVEARERAQLKVLLQKYVHPLTPGELQEVMTRLNSERN